MSTPADTVFFAIQAGLKLYGGMRKAYADSTRGRALILPLPRAPGVKIDSAFAWFRLDPVGQQVAQRHARISWLIKRNPRTSSEDRELMDSYLVFFSEASPNDGAFADVAGQLATDEFEALLSIRQWSGDEPGAPRSVLQQVAGTVINIAIDYYANTPGAVSEKSPEGRLLLAFLQALDREDVDFANTPVRELAGDLLLGVLSGISSQPEVFGGGEFEQLFIKNVATSLSVSAGKFLETATATERRTAGPWLQLLARSLVAGGAETVLSNPVRFLDAEEGGQAALVTAVGSTLAELLLVDEFKVTFRGLLSGDGLTKVTQAALGAVAANPDLITVKNEGLKNILVALAGDLAKYDAPFTSDLFPELARLTLERTAENMDLVWGRRFQSPDRHLLVTASRSLLHALAKKPPSGTAWKPTLTQAQILGVLETVFDEVVENPDWLVARAGGEEDTLGAAVAAMLDALRQFDGRRISADAGMAMLRAGLLAVGTRLELLEQLPAGGQDAGKVALTAAVDLIIGTLVGDDDQARANWRLARNSTLQVLVEVALAALAKHGATQADLDALREVLDELIQGELDVDSFGARLENRLAA